MTVHPSLDLTGRRFFLTPVCLVPNGRAHLGHIAGPLLKMDVLRRHVRRGGGEAVLMTLSDVHESHVAVQAHKEGVPPEELATRYTGQIRQDLAALNIAYDDLVNPLTEEWRDRYTDLVHGFVEDIVAAGHTAVRSRPVTVLAAEKEPRPHPHSLRPQAGEPVVSGWLKGTCPDCAHPLVGFFCESCGGCFDPAQMTDPTTAHFEGELAFEERNSLWLEVPGGAPAVLAHLEKAGVREDFQEIVRRHLRRNGTGDEASIRLTVPNPWGIPWHGEGIPDNEVIWSYSALLIGCHMVAGERYAELTGTGVNPFAADSGVTCVLSFGIDNTIGYLLGGVGTALAQDRFKPVDNFLVNYFYDLDGSKFSTSRRHVIWGGDIVTLAKAEPDLVRAYLCHRNPEFRRENFGIDEFLAFHNDFGARLTEAVRACEAVLAANSPAAEQAGRAPVERELLLAELRRQSESLTPGTFSMRGALDSIERWLGLAHALSATPAGAATWLLGIALLGHPVVPELASSVWLRLGLAGEPGLAAGLATPEVGHHPDAAEAVAYRVLTTDELNACLPAALQR